MSPEVETTLAPLIAEFLRSKEALGQLTFDVTRKTGYRLRRLSVSFGSAPLDEFDRLAIEQWLEGLGHLSPSTRRLNLSDAKVFCGWLVHRGVIKTDPTWGIRLPKPRFVSRALPDDDVRRLLAVVPDARGRVIVTSMLYLGLRCIEVSRARIDDIDLRARTILVHGKGGHERVLPFGDQVHGAIVAYLAEASPGPGPLVRSKANPHAGLTPLYISTMLARWMADAGLKRGRNDGVSAHALRHTAASDVFARSNNLRAVQKMLGHQSLDTTERYLRNVDIGQLREAMSGRSYQ